MAEATSIVGGNKTLGPPEGMEHSVLPLEVYSPSPRVTSAWKLTKSEIEEIVETGKVYLTVMGTTMPPAFIGSETETRAFLIDGSIMPGQD